MGKVNYLKQWVGQELDDPDAEKVTVPDTKEIGEIGETGEYDEERRHAGEIALLSEKKLNGEAAAYAVASAVVECRAHPVTLEGDGLICFEYDNSFGPTCTVDDVLERMNMRDWRMACDEFCKLMLKKGGLDPEDYEWPTPLPKVMKVPEDEGTDVISRVVVTFKVNERTYDRILDIVDRKDDGEETCCNCDTQIKYRVENGKTVVVCPECGTIQPICSECPRPEHERNACGGCTVWRKCRELNERRAEIRSRGE